MIRKLPREILLKKITVPIFNEKNELVIDVMWIPIVDNHTYPIDCGKLEVALETRNIV